MLTITPTIGRRVLLFVGTGGTSGPHINDSAVPFDAGIVYVHSSGHVQGESMVNVGYRDHNGAPHQMTSVKLLDRPQDNNDRHGMSYYAVWMPYQFEQAVRASQPRALPPAGAHPGDVELVKLAENGVLTPEGEAKVAAGGEVLVEDPDGGEAQERQS